MPAQRVAPALSKSRAALISNSYLARLGLEEDTPWLIPLFHHRKSLS
jgi:hypothetical protein